MIPLGILSAQAALAGYDLLSSVTLASDSANVTFNSGGKWADYKHLRLQMLTRSSGSVALDETTFSFNGDTGSNYNGKNIYANNTTIGHYPYTLPQMQPATLPGATNSASVFGMALVDILDINNTAMYTSLIQLSGEAGDVPRLSMGTTQWRNTAALTSITMQPNSGGNFKAGSQFILIGVAG